MPWAKLQYERERETALRGSPLSYIKPKTFIRDFPNLVIYIGSIGKGTNGGQDIHDVWVWFLDSQKRVIRFVHAESGKVDFDAATSEFVVPLSNARDEEHDRKAPDDLTEALKVSTLREVDPLRLSLAHFLGAGAVHQKLQWMTYGELLKERARLRAEPAKAGEEKQHLRDIMNVSLTIQDKINWALAILSFVFVGVPLGIKVSRKETSANLGVAVVLALAYYLGIVVVGWLDPSYRPDLLIWLPNLALLGLGFWLLERVDRA
jgi:lipopolysaccharide export system permease protein